MDFLFLYETNRSSGHNQLSDPFCCIFNIPYKYTAFLLLHFITLHSTACPSFCINKRKTHPLASTKLLLIKITTTFPFADCKSRFHLRDEHYKSAHASLRHNILLESTINKKISSALDKFT